MRRDQRAVIPCVLHSPALTRSPGVAGGGSRVSSPHLSECETALLPGKRGGFCRFRSDVGNLKAQSH